MPTKKIRRTVFAFLLPFLTQGCGSSSSPAGKTLPLVTPPVRAATPTGLKGTSRSLDQTEFKTVFFGTGPAVLFTILGAVDSRLTEINSGTGSHPCTSQTPVSYTLTPWAGESMTMYAQCYRSVGTATATDPEFFMWGVDSGGVVYLWVAIGDGWIAAVVTPLTTGSASAGTNYKVRVWYSVGINLGINGGSYGVAEIYADPSTGTFEMSTAGKAMGYCGAQLRSDGTNIYANGSAEGGGGCVATDNICVLASDNTTPATCTTAEQAFTLPALGRTNAGGLTASPYPASPNVVLDGTSSDAVHFGNGPTTPPAGVTQF